MTLSDNQCQRYERFRRWRNDWDIDGGVIRDIWKLKHRTERDLRSAMRREYFTGPDLTIAMKVDRRVEEYLRSEEWARTGGIFNGPARVLHEALQEARHDPERWEYLMGIAETFMEQHPAPPST